MNRLTKKNTALTAGFMVMATLLAKLCGMMRDIVMASLYGTDTNAAIAFSTASRIPLLFFDIALGSAVTSAFIPIFNEYLAKNEKEKAMQFSNQFISLVVLITLLMVGLGIVFSRQFIWLIAGGLDADKLQLASQLVVILFPTIFFTGLAYCFVGVLQSYGEFYIPSIISLVSNGLLVLYLLVFGDKFGIHGVAVAMLCAWATQCLVQLPSLWKIRYRFKPSISFRSEGIRRACKLALPIIISTWMQPINTMVNIRLASGLNGGEAVTALDYANKLYIILVGVFTFTVTNLIFPSLSRASATDDTRSYREIITKALRYIVFIIAPIMVGFLILSKPIIRLFYERNAFTEQSTQLTSLALFCYSLGMLGYGIQEISNKGFYALHNGKTPMKVAFAGIAVNISLSILFVLGFRIGLGGLALAASIAANVIGFTLLWLLHRKVGNLLDRTMAAFFARIAVCVLAMGAGVYAAYQAVLQVSANKLVVLFCPVVVGVVLYFGLCLLLRVPELTDLIDMVRKKLMGGRNN